MVISLRLPKISLGQGESQEVHQEMESLSRPQLGHRILPTLFWLKPLGQRSMILCSGTAKARMGLFNQARGPKLRFHRVIEANVRPRPAQDKEQAVQSCCRQLCCCRHSITKVITTHQVCQSNFVATTQPRSIMPRAVSLLSL